MISLNKILSIIKLKFIFNIKLKFSYLYFFLIHLRSFLFDSRFLTMDSTTFSLKQSTCPLTVTKISSRLGYFIHLAIGELFHCYIFFILYECNEISKLLYT